jgi:hypothetical protein
MADESTDPDEGLIGEVAPTPQPKPQALKLLQPWHRLRKTFVRATQWNAVIESEVLARRSGVRAGEPLRMLGLPSSDYLDLLSLDTLCGKHGVQVLYLGFNAAADPEGTRRPIPLSGVIGLTESHVDRRSILVPDWFEELRHFGTMPNLALKDFGGLDVINLDLCGHIIDPNPNKAGDTLSALLTVFEHQARVHPDPWLLFLTTYSDPPQISHQSMLKVIRLVAENCSKVADFRTELETFCPDTRALLAALAQPAPPTMAQQPHNCLLTLAISKWVLSCLADKLKVATVELLDCYCYRPDGVPDPKLLSLAFIVRPVPPPPLTTDPAGIVKRKTVETPLDYPTCAKRLVKKAYSLTDLDQYITNDPTLRGELVAATRQMLVDRDFDPDAVDRFLQLHAT